MVSAVSNLYIFNQQSEEWDSNPRASASNADEIILTPLPPDIIYLVFQSKKNPQPFGGGSCLSNCELYLDGYTPTTKD